MSKVTIEQIHAKILSSQFISPFGTTLTICVLTLENGFTVTGESFCFDPANYDAKSGADIAYSNAVDKVWSLEYYALAERLHAEKLAAESAQAAGVTAENVKTRKPRKPKAEVAEPAQEPAPTAEAAPAKPRRARKAA